MTATATATKTGSERRSAVRRQPTLGTVCKLDAADRVGLVWNISAGGVSMLLGDRLERGATVKGTLTTADEGFTLPVNLRVLHVAELKTGDYLIGGQFDRPLAADEMKHFLPA